MPLKPNGPSQAAIGKKCYYTTSTTDPDGDSIYYFFDWGDGKDGEWQGPYNSGEQCNISYRWATKGTYEIKVKAKDIYGFESEWSDPLQVSIPQHRFFPYTFFDYLRYIPLFKELLNLFF